MEGQLESPWWKYFSFYWVHGQRLSVRFQQKVCSCDSSVHLMGTAWLLDINIKAKQRSLKKGHLLDETLLVFKQRINCLFHLWYWVSRYSALINIVLLFQWYPLSWGYTVKSKSMRVKGPGKSLHGNSLPFTIFL